MRVFVFNICVKLWSIFLFICWPISCVVCYICVFTISIEDECGYFCTGNEDNLLLNFYKTYLDLIKDACYYFWLCLWKCIYFPCLFIIAGSLLLLTLFCPDVGSIFGDKLLFGFIKLMEENEWLIVLVPPEPDTFIKE